MVCKSRGASILEMMIVISILSLVLSVGYRLMITGREKQVEIHGVLALTGDVLSGTRQIRKDLQVTTLSSVKVFKNEPACSMASVSEKQHVTGFGTPAWDSHIFYTLEAGKDGFSRLVRWVQLTGTIGSIPKPSLLNPWEVPSGVKSRSVMSQVLSPRYALKENGGKYSVEAEAESPGGFQVRFVRRTESGTRDSVINPSARGDSKTPRWTAGNTSLVKVKLTVLKPKVERASAAQFELLIAPRN